MRILVTSPTYPPSNTGLGNAVFQQVAYLASQGHEVVIATGGAERSTTISDGVLIERFVITGADCWLQPIRGERAVYKEFLCEKDWDIVLLNAWQNWATDIALKNLDQISGRKFVYSHCISTNVFFYQQPLRSLVRYFAWRPYWWRLKGFMKRLNGVLFLADDGSDSRFDDLRLAKRYRIPFGVIPNALSPSAARALLAPSMKFGERDRLIAVGSYTWQKGFDFVIRAYASSQACKHFPLHIYGQEYTAHTDYLRDLVKKLKLGAGSVVFHEGVSGDQLIVEYSRAKLILTGSHTECQPLVLIDANATGTPFVARTSGCIKSMAGGVGVGTWKEMADQIDRLSQSGGSWTVLADAGRSAAKCSSPDMVGQRLVKNLMGSLRNRDV